MIRSSYDGDGRLTGQWQPTAQTWTTVHGQTAQASGPAGTQNYTYDHARRLTKVQDHYYGWCTTRTYTFDANTNRISTSSYPPAADGACSTDTTPATVTSTYDAADRITDSGYTHDALGRTLAVPGGQVSGGDDLTVGYYANDMVASLSQGGQTRTFGLDAAGRISQMTKAEGTVINHFADSGDSPAWITEADGSWTRNVTSGGLSAIQNSNGTTVLQFANLHGDIVATLTVWLFWKGWSWTVNKVWQMFAEKSTPVNSPVWKGLKPYNRGVR